MNRKAMRFVVWLPVSVHELPEGMAVTHDVSGAGALLVTASRLEMDAPVTISFAIPPDGREQKTVHGRVVRVEPNREDPEGMWRHRLAVAFDHPVPDLEAILSDLSGRGIAKVSK